ncbi:hypothetical protein V5O48_007849, partial [Marasmius crinis-equi]
TQSWPNCARNPLRSPKSSLTSRIQQIRIGTVTYTIPDMMSYTPVLNKKFLIDFSVIVEVFRKEPHKIGLGSTLSAVTSGMPALEGLAAAIEMLDTLTSSCPTSGPGRPVVSCIFHVTAVLPDKTVNPQWNDLDSLDHLTWENLPSELQSRNIHFSSILVNPDTSIYPKLHASGSAPAWFPVKPSHTVLLSPYFSTALPTATKRPAEPTAMDKSPDAKRPRITPNVPSPSLANVKSPQPPNPNPNARASPLPVPGPVPGAPPTLPPGLPPGAPARLTNQQLSMFAQRLRALEERIPKVEAMVVEAAKAGDKPKAEALNVELNKLRVAHRQLKEYLTMQIAQVKMAAQGGQAQGQQQQQQQQQPAAGEQGPSNGGAPPPPAEQAEARPPSTTNPRVPTPQNPNPNPNPSPQQPPPKPSPAGPIPPNNNMPNPSPSLTKASPSMPPQHPNVPPNMSNLAANPMGGNVPPGIGSRPMMNDITAQMNKMVEQSERAGIGGPRMGMPGGPGGGMMPHPNPGLPGPGPSPQFKPPNMVQQPPPPPPPPPQQQQQQSHVPVWQGKMCWRPDAMNQGREVNAHIAVLAGSNNGSHSETWPKTIFLSSAAQPINPTDVQTWFAQHKNEMFLGKLVPTGPDVLHQDYKFLFSTMLAQRIYLLGAWTTPNGGQTNNLLIAAAPNNGLVGAFFPHNGLPELPKPTTPLLPLSQPQQPPPQPQPPTHQPPQGGMQPPVPPGPGPTSNLASALPPEMKELITRVRAIPDDMQRAGAAQNLVVRLQHTMTNAGRQLSGPEMQVLLNAMNTSVQQIQRMRMVSAGGGGGGGGPQGMPGQQPGQPQPSGMMMPGGGPGMNMVGRPGGGAPGGGGMYNPMLAVMNAQRGNMGGMNMGLAQQMMGRGGPGPGMQGMAGGGPGMGNLSMEMLQSFAQRNQNGGMGQGPG